MTRPAYKPVYEEAEEVIRDRIVSRISDEWRKDPGDFIYDAVAPTAPEVVVMQQGQDTILRRAFAQYATEDEFLALKMAEIGLKWIEATYAKRRLSIDAVAGVTIPKGHIATTVTLVSEGEPLQYTVDEALTVTTAGTRDIIITCKKAGKIGSDVIVGADFLLLPPIPGIKTITDQGVVVPGQDRETNDEAYARYDFKVKHPDTGGNKNDYRRWVEPMDGVGRLRVIPRWNGNGTVKVVLVGDDFLPATPEVVAAVQDYLDPILNATVQAEDLTLGGYGATKNAADITLAYNASGAATATLGSLDALLETENHFKAVVKVKVDSTAGSANLLQIRVLAGGVPLKQTKGGSTDADVTKKANQLSTDYGFVDVPFYYDGIEALTLEVKRLTTDTTTLVTVDLVNLVGVYGQGLGMGQAPGGARVLAKAADELAVNIAATAVFAANTDKAAALAAFWDAVTAYLQEEVTFVDTDKKTAAPIVRAKIGGLLIATPGVVNYSGLTVNGGTSDIIPTKEQVPVLGTVTI